MQEVLVLNLIFVNEIPLGREIYVKLLSASLPQETITRFLSSPTSHIEYCWYPQSPNLFPFACLLSVSTVLLLYNHSCSFIIGLLALRALSSIFVMVQWYITNTIKPFMILQLSTIASRLQGWKISDITADTSSFPFIGSVRTNAEMLH